MLVKKNQLWTATISIVLFLGVITLVTAENSTEKSNPVVSVAIGMDPAEVMALSTYPIKFTKPFYPDFHSGKDLRYDFYLDTADIDYRVLGPHEVYIPNIRYWSIKPEFDRVASFEGRQGRLTINEALNQATDWARRMDEAGWDRSDEPEHRISAQNQKTRKNKYLNTLGELKASLLRIDDNKAVGGTIGVWFSKDKTQWAAIGIEQRDEFGLPLGADKPIPTDSAESKTFQISFNVMYTEHVIQQRSKDEKQLLEEALSKIKGQEK